jgi:hypothetical protein
MNEKFSLILLYVFSILGACLGLVGILDKDLLFGFIGVAILFGAYLFKKEFQVDYIFWK